MAMALNASEQERINNVYNEREKALAENNSMYEGLINQAGETRNQQNAYLAQQEAIQNQAIDQQLEYQKGVIDNQKQEAAQNKRVEENKAINDYTSYINPYGLQNERLYSAGLGNSGVSETSKLGAYTVYQNRVSAANSALQKAYTDYDNAYNQAVNEGNVQKAQNALTKLKLEIQNEQDYFNNVSSLTQKKLSTANSLTAHYDDLYNTVYNQIMKEQAEAEAARQWEAEQKLKEQQLALQQQAAKTSTTSSSSSSKSSKNTTSNTINVNGKQVDPNAKTTVMIGAVPVEVTYAQALEIQNNPNGALAKELKDYVQYQMSNNKANSSSSSSSSKTTSSSSKASAGELLAMATNPAYLGYKVGSTVADTFKRLFGGK